MENEEKKEEKVEESKVQSDSLENLTTERDAIREEGKSNELNEAKKSIMNQLDTLNIPEELKKIKLKLFAETKGLEGVETEKDIPEELKSEYDEFKLDSKNPDVVSLFEAAKKVAIDISTQRQNKMNELYGRDEDIGRIQKLKDNITNKKSELEKSKEGATPEKIKEIDEQINRLDEMDKEIGDKEKDTGLFKEINEVKKQQDVVAAVVYEKLDSRFSPYVSDAHDMIYKDERLNKALGKYDEETKKVTRDLNNIEIDDKEKDDKQENKQEKEQVAEKEGKIPPEVAAQLAKQMAGQPVVGNGNVVAQYAQEVNQEEPKIDYAMMLGYDDKMGLDYNSSREILNVFLGEKVGPTGANFDDKTRVELLNSPEAAQILQKALLTMNDNSDHLNFLRKHWPLFNGHSKINKKMMNMFSKQLPKYLKDQESFISENDKKIIQDDLGMDGFDLNKDIQEQLQEFAKEGKLDELSKNAKSLSETYNEDINELKNKLNDESLSETQKEEYQKKLDNIIEKNKAFSTIYNHINTYKFKEIASEATEGKIKADSMLKSSDKIEQKKPMVEELDDLRKGFREDLSKGKSSPDAAELSADERKKEEQEKKSVGEQEIDGPDAPGQS